VRARHERGHLLVPRLNERRIAARPGGTRQGTR
jgi:hypothetical protein